MAKNQIATLTLERAAENAVKLLNDAAAENVKILANAAEKAVQAISQSALNASKVVAEDAAAAAKALNVKNADGGSDHDFLLSFASKTTEKLENIGNDVKELKTGTEHRISALETEKLSIKDSYPILYKKDVDDKLSDYEKRIRDNEKNITKIVAIGSILLVITEAVVALIIKFVK
jgi:hypothetical protein